MLRPLMVKGRPHWEHRFPEEVWPFFEDFRNALVVTWEHLGLPQPTKAQLEIACRLQYGVDSVEWRHLPEDDKVALLESPRNDIIRAYRGVGKSYITAAFAAWKLARNPRDEKTLVVSATATKSKAFVSQLRGLLKTMPVYKWLMEGERELGETRRDQADRFDVALSSLSQSPSVRAAAILGQLAGDRATTVIADDIEIIQNSSTEDARDKILNVCREFGVIVKTENDRGDIIFLGTPQTEESVYNRMVSEQRFTCFTIPVRYPSEDKLDNYSLVYQESEERLNILAYYLRDQHQAGILQAGDLTDPSRFTLVELAKEEAKGKAYFALQMMLDTSLSDAERYPLRQHDLMLMSVNEAKAPITIQWGRHTDGKNWIHDIANLGFSGDYFLRPLMVDPEWAPYDGSVLFVDPSGRGADETAWAIVKTLNGVMYLADVDGYKGDPAEAMVKIALAAKKHKVNVVEVEPNFGQGMWVAAFGPILHEVWPGGCTVQESEWAKGQKETRIIDTLEPVMTRHRLVVDETLVRNESKKRSEADINYSLLYQLTHITRDRGSLKHDDRLDAVAGAVSHFQKTVSQDMDEAAQAVLDQRMEEEIEDFVSMMTEGVPVGRGLRRGPLKNGQRDEVWVSRW